MNEINTSAKLEVEVASHSVDRIKVILSSLLMAGLILWTLRQISPPDAAPAGAPLTEFSSARAMEQLRVIARNPHPIGSSEEARVRDYLLSELNALGLSPELQTTTVVNPGGGYPALAATVHNIIAKLPGAESDKALLFVAHYDSVPTGPGAGDNGSAVAALLETLRAIMTGARLRNDLVVLFTDGEEVGLLGAKAFVEEHAMANKVGLVLNFEARGNRGPSTMFETSDNNGWLIREFAKAAVRPLASSVSYEVYKRLPNDSDLTVFKKAGFNGLNFAFIEGLSHYHTQLDSIEKLDERSLQHHGTYVLALARHFGNLKLEGSSDGNAIYFNVPGLTIVHYPESWAAPLALVTTFLFVTVLFFGLKKKHLTITGMGIGFSALLLALLLSTLVMTGIWRLVTMLHTDYVAPLQQVYNSDTYMIAFTALTVSITLLFLLACLTRLSVQDLAAGCLFWWLMLMLLVSFNLPGGSYLLTWPLLFSLISFPALFVPGDQARISTGRLAINIASAIPGILLFVPMIYLIYVAMTLRMLAVVVVMIVLLIGLLVPAIAPLARATKWMLPVATTIIGLVFIAIGSFTSGFDKDAPKPTDLFYAVNADTGKGAWASYGQRSDEWTSKYFAGEEKAGDLNDYIPSQRQALLKSSASPLIEGSPNITLLDDKTDDGVRQLRLRIGSTRHAPIISLRLNSNVEVVRASVNGKAFTSEPNRKWALRYYGLPQDGIELALHIKGSEPLKFQALDVSYGLPEIPGRPTPAMPDHLIPSLNPLSNSAVVSKSFTF